MKQFLSILAAVLAFVLVTSCFVQGLRGQPESREEGLVFQRPIQTEAATAPTVPETEETKPPETIPPETQPVKIRQFTQPPLYDQTACSEIRYQYGTVATSGSNIVCLAMAASYLTDQEYRPEELASWFAGYIGNPMQWLEYVSDQLQLPWRRTANIDETIREVKSGKIAVIRMNEGSLFMEGPHFLLLTGVTEEGKLLIQDPYGPNYTQWHLENALKNGFDRGDLTGSYSGAWVYDPAAMPEEPFIYTPPANPDTFRYGDLTLSQEDKDLIVKLVCVEGESEPFEGQQAIAEVILNRMAAKNFPGTAKGVIFAEGQFLAAGQLHTANPSHIQYEALERALNGPYVLDGDVVFFSKYAVNDNVWGTIGSHIYCRQW